jgi:hypothetical protein
MNRSGVTPITLLIAVFAIFVWAMVSSPNPEITAFQALARLPQDVVLQEPILVMQPLSHVEITEDRKLQWQGVADARITYQLMDSIVFAEGAWYKPVQIYRADQATLALSKLESNHKLGPPIGKNGLAVDYNQPEIVIYERVYLVEGD